MHLILKVEKIISYNLLLFVGHLLVVIEIAENGSLLEFLQNSRKAGPSSENIDRGLTEQMKVQIAIDVATGMAHLAKCRVSYQLY